MKIKTIFIALTSILIGYFAEAACYVNPLPNYNCMTTGRDITDIPWLPNFKQRVILYNSPDVQESSLGCSRFAYLMQTECKLNEPITAVYYPIAGNTDRREVTFALAPLPKLIEEKNLSKSYKDYFAGTLTDISALGAGQSATPPKVIDYHSRDEVMNFLTKPVGHTLKFSSSCQPQGAIVADGEFMASCVKDANGKFWVILQRVASGCTTCIDKIEALLGRLNYLDYNSTALTDPDIANVPAIASYTDLQMPLLSQFSTYIPKAMGLANYDANSLQFGFCYPTALTMAVDALKKRSSPFTMLGNIFDLPGCAHMKNDQYYGDCSLKIAEISDQIGATAGYEVGRGPGGADVQKIAAKFNRSIIQSSNNATLEWGPGGLKVNGEYSAVPAPPENVVATYDYVGWEETAKANYTTLAEAQQKNWMSIAANLWQKTAGVGYFFRTNVNTSIRPSVPLTLPLDARRTWVIGFYPALFNTSGDASGHAVTVSAINSTYLTVNDPHGIKYNILPKPCGPLLKQDGFTVKYFVSETLTQQPPTYPSYQETYKRQLITMTNPRVSGEVGTCLTHYGGAASTLFTSHPFWVPQTLWGALPWGDGPKWDQNTADFRNDTASLIAEQNGVTRSVAFQDPKTLAKCATNSLNIKTSIAGVDFYIKNLEPLSANRVGTTSVLCSKFESREAKATGTLRNYKYGQVSVACENENLVIKKMECSDNTKFHLAIANGVAYKTWNDTAKVFSDSFVIVACNDNWQVSTAKNSCVCEDPNGTNQVVWSGAKASCNVICKAGYVATMTTDRKYKCTPQTEFSDYTILGDGTCRYKNRQGQTLDGKFENAACRPPKEGETCPLTATTQGVIANASCVVPDGTACSLAGQIKPNPLAGTSQNDPSGLSYPGQTLKGACRVSDNTACTFKDGFNESPGKFLNNLCLAIDGATCIAANSLQDSIERLSGSYSGGRCLPIEGVACTARAGIGFYPGQYRRVSGQCVAIDGQTCSGSINEGLFKGPFVSKITNGQCMAPNGHPCASGQEGAEIIGAYLNGFCSVESGTPCTFVTDFGQSITGKIDGNRCMPPDKTECLATNAPPGLQIKGQTHYGFCQVPGGTDCSYATPTNRYFYSKFYQNSCVTVVDGNPCEISLGFMNNIKGRYFNGQCVVSPGTSCIKYGPDNISQLSGQYFNGVCTEADNTSCQFEGYPQYQAKYMSGVCTVPDGLSCSLTVGTQTYPAKFKYNICTIEDDVHTCQTTRIEQGMEKTYPGKIKNNTCQMNDGLTCRLQDSSSAWVQGITKNNSCVYRDGLACNVYLGTTRYPGTGVNGKCFPANGLACARPGFGSVQTAFLNGQCLPVNGQVCKTEAVVAAQYVNGICVPNENSPCASDPTDSAQTGKVIQGVCQRTTAVTPTTLGVEGSACSVNAFVSRPAGRVINGQCLVNDNVACIKMNYGTRLSGFFQNRVCRINENTACKVDNNGTLRSGKITNSVCVPTQGGACTKYDAIQNKLINGTYNAGVCQ